MVRTTERPSAENRAERQSPRERAPLIPVFAFGMALGLFFVISYVLCVVFYFLFPSAAANHAVLMFFLPGFELLSWGSFILGLVESFAYGSYVALVFGPLYNYFAVRMSSRNPISAG